MAEAHADALQAEIEGSNTWPLKREQDILARVRMHRAFRQSDEGYLEQVSGFRTSSAWRRDDRYITDPLPHLISTAFADLIFGAEPKFEAESPNDELRLTEIIDRNQFASELHRAARISSSECEVWWRTYVDRAALDVPVVQWVSRLCVTPMWRAGRLLACAFTTELSRVEDRVIRHVEVHATGETRNLFFDGTGIAIGSHCPPPTGYEDLPPVWVHGLPMLCGRVVNNIDDDPTVGRSDYDGVESLFLALNEANTIDAKNARLTARKRIFADRSVLNDRGEFNVHDDVIVTNAKGGSMDASGNASTNPPPVSAVELSFDADQMQTHINGLTDRILTRVGVAPQLVGRVQGDRLTADSGAALRARMMHSVLAAQGKSRYWQDELPRLLLIVAQLDALKEQDGGFGTAWVDRVTPPTLELAEVLPEDPSEEVTRFTMGVAGEIMSRRTAVEGLHPDWTEEQYEAELAAIREDTAPPPVDVSSLGEHAHEDLPQIAA